MSENLLPVAPPKDLAVARPVPTVADMLQGVIAGGVTTQNVAAVEQIVKLYERMQEKDAEKEFARAFVELQSEMQSIQATRAVPNNDGGVRYKFAPFEEIMKEVGPGLKKHGFTVTFSTEYLENRLVKICTLQHVGGHIRTNKFAVRIGSGPPKASEAQADGAASTYAKRFALCDALNIQIDHDTDARAEGGTISLPQAASLRERVRVTGSDEVRFLKFAGATTFEEIRESKYAILDDLLLKREKGKHDPA